MGLGDRVLERVITALVSLGLCENVMCLLQLCNKTQRQLFSESSCFFESATAAVAAAAAAGEYGVSSVIAALVTSCSLPAPALEYEAQCPACNLTDPQASILIPLAAKVLANRLPLFLLLT